MEPAWSHRPPIVPSSRVWTPEPGKHELVVLGPWLGVWVHWCGKRSLPCLDDACPKSRHFRPVRWVGYLPAARVEKKLVNERMTALCHSVVVPVGAEQASELEPALGTYPGPSVVIAKTKTAKEWKIEKVRRLENATGLPACPDVALVLYRLWGIRPPSKELPGEVD